jgi:hypothetical protein
LAGTIKEEHRERTGFTVPSGHYEFIRLPFGLINSPSNFQRLMDIVLRNGIGTHCYVFIDDLIVFSKTAEEHAQLLEEVLSRLEEANLQLHPGKCVIAQLEVRYLGYVLSDKGVSPTPDKVTAVRQYPVPKYVKDVRALVGLASFYRILVLNFAEIAKPLTGLTRKDRQFTWGPQQQAFQSIKDRLCTTPVLAYPNFEVPFILTTDASMVAIAAICHKYKTEKSGRWPTQVDSLTQRNKIIQFLNRKCYPWCGQPSTFAVTCIVSVS